MAQRVPHQADGVPSGAQQLTPTRHHSPRQPPRQVSRDRPKSIRWPSSSRTSPDLRATHLEDWNLEVCWSEAQTPEVGSGSLDFAAILKTAASVAVKHYFVEQDQTPGDPIDSLKKSYDYLRSVKL
jgi:hypothetical protein